MEKKYVIMDGNEACSHASYMFTEIAGIYPITPSSTMAEFVDDWSNKNKLNFFGDKVKVVQMQSEAGAIGLIHGAALTGCLTTTYTSSQGLLLMIPNMYKIAGELLPCVINVAARSLSTHALSILGDHQDIYSTLSTGFSFIASSSVEQVMYMTSLSYLSTIKGRIPVLNFFDGFRTSHELQKIECLDMDRVKDLIDIDSLNKFRKNGLNLNNPVTRGTAQNDDIYFQMSEARNKYYLEFPDIINDNMKKLNEISGFDFKPFNYYGNVNATKVIVAMGSVCETIRETINYLNDNKESVGLIEVHLFRPFSEKYFLNVLPDTVKEIAVLDRSKEGIEALPLYLDVLNIISNNSKNINVVGGRYGLSSKNTTPAMIKAVYDFLSSVNKFNGFTIGIEDDVTNKSLSIEDFKLPNSTIEFLVYGYGSDGMISASKDIMKIVGDNTNAYVQGYFQYDSKKSGGVTKSHLRFSKDKILSTYYVDSPSLIMTTKDSYISKYNLLRDIKNNGTFIINTNKNISDLEQLITKEDLDIIKNRNIKVYKIDADLIASNNNLGNKISVIMESIIFKLGKIIDYDFAVNSIKNSVSKKFSLKSNDIVHNNINSMNEASDYLEEVIFEKGLFDKKDNLSMIDIINNKEGDSLKVSSFIEVSDGTLKGGTSINEKRSISSTSVSYTKDNCIMCNQCSIVCPHGVIRPFLLNDLEYDNAPSCVKDKCMLTTIDGINYYYTIGVSYKDCTGCNLCEYICPGKKGNKALTVEIINKPNIFNDEEVDYLFNKVSEKDINITNFKMSQFKTPKFTFSGACSGCGETSYLKLLTQLFKDELIIANATGCSSIYGGSYPSSPYQIPWASSLFEDNAEFGFGFKISDNYKKEKIVNLIKNNIDKVNGLELPIYSDYINNFNYVNSKKLFDIIDNTNIEGLNDLKDYIIKKSVWNIGGDGWAYDIGFSGIDQVLSSGENINVLVLDTEGYSNTGGQASKSSHIGAVLKFASDGKNTNRKDLVSIAMEYNNAYVATISLGANMQHTLKTLIEAENYDGPSIIIAYAPCISHGIIDGLNSPLEQKLAVECGYFPLVRYNPSNDKFSLDSKADFSLYDQFLERENRYRILSKINPDKFIEMRDKNKKNSMMRYEKFLNKSKNEK